MEERERQTGRGETHTNMLAQNDCTAVGTAEAHRFGSWLSGGMNGLAGAGKVFSEGAKKDAFRC
jgi:hypothetical protein